MRISIVVVMGVALHLVIGAWAQPTAVRTLPNEVYIPGFQIKVTIDVTGGPNAVTVVEHPPSGWTVDRVTGGGQWSDDVITWNLEPFTGVKALRYYITPASSTDGEGIFSGTVDGQEIGGMTRMIQYEMPESIRLPELTGPHAVGTVIRHLVDESRDEIHSPNNPDDKRELMVQFWYPADVPEGAERAPYLPSPEAEIVVELLKSSAFWGDLSSSYWDGFLVLSTNSGREAPLADRGSEYPVLIYSPGTSAPRWSNTSLMEQLASHGYVVAAIDHTYESPMVVFPDGRVVPGATYSDPTRIADIRFMLDELSGSNKESPLHDLFADRLDLARVGVLGMSRGGQVAQEVLLRDARFKAGLNLDGAILFSTEQPIMHLKKVSGSFPEAMEMVGYHCEIRETLHYDFADFPLVWHLLDLPGRFPTNSATDDAVRVNRVIADYSVAFFDKILKGRSVPLLDASLLDYPEVEFTIYGEPEGLSRIKAEEWTMY
ncbi:MAG: hypothetical protein ABIH23_21595 [bacterium]